MAKALSNKVLLIGWDAADWKVIAPLVDLGKSWSYCLFIQLFDYLQSPSALVGEGFRERGLFV